MTVIAHLVEVTIASVCWQESESQAESNSREVVLF